MSFHWLTFKSHRCFYIIVSLIIFCEDNSPINHRQNLRLVKRDSSKGHSAKGPVPRGSNPPTVNDTSVLVEGSFVVVLINLLNTNHFGSVHEWNGKQEMCWSRTSAVLGEVLGLLKLRCDTATLCFSLVLLPQPKGKAAPPFLCSWTKACGRLQLSV